MASKAQTSRSSGSIRPFLTRFRVTVKGLSALLTLGSDGHYYYQGVNGVPMRDNIGIILSNSHMDVSERGAGLSLGSICKTYQRHAVSIQVTLVGTHQSFWLRFRVAFTILSRRYAEIFCFRSVERSRFE